MYAYYQNFFPSKTLCVSLGNISQLFNFMWYMLNISFHMKARICVFKIHTTLMCVVV